MGFKTGIVGLPNVGKSTIFNALTSAKAEAANFPFCTIEPNTGIVKVPDPRVEDIAKLFEPENVVHAAMTFVDIAGLVKGASQGEGLGNQFLAHIRETNAITHVVRCFEDSNIVHVDGKIDPLSDIEVIETELCLADLETVCKRYEYISKLAKGGDKKAQAKFSVMENVRKHLEEGKPVRSLGLYTEQLGQIKEFNFLTLKPVLYVANVSDTDIENPDANTHVKKLKEYASQQGSGVIVLCGKIESEISELEEAEKAEFLKDFNMTEPGLNRVIRAGYGLLNLQTYFTAGKKEVRAWTVRKNCTAPEAAGVIHTDFQKGFIKAEVYHYNDLMEYKTEAAIKDAGLMRLEGKEYVVKDGDVMHFRFNV